jgi:hypothetical protein
MLEAIAAEKRIKGKSRKWKEDLIGESNSEWRFLNQLIVSEWPPKIILEDPYFQYYIRNKK